MVYQEVMVNQKMRVSFRSEFNGILKIDGIPLLKTFITFWHADIVVCRQEILKHSPNNRFIYLGSFVQVV